MASVTSPTNSNSRDLDPLVLVSSGAAKLKRAVTGTTATASGITPDTAALEVGTNVDDAAFGVATGTVVAMAALADETATDSVDEGDAGALRMTLNRRLINAGHFLDDTAYGVATDYVNASGFMADATSPDSVDEGDVGVARMTLARKQIVVSSADAATLTQVNSSNTSQTILASNANRIGALIFNTDANNLYLAFTASAATTSAFTVKIAAGGYYEFPQPVYRGQVTGIWDVDGSGAAVITELT